MTGMIMNEFKVLAHAFVQARRPRDLMAERMAVPQAPFSSLDQSGKKHQLGQQGYKDICMW